MKQLYPRTSIKVYAAPQSALPGAEALTPARLRARAFHLFAASVAVFAFSIALVILRLSPFGAVVFVVSALIALAGAVWSLVALVRGIESRGPASGSATALALALLSVGMSCVGIVAAFLSTMTFSRGRQIRSFGKVLLPPVEPGEAWTASAGSMSSIDVDIDIDDGATRRALAAQWRENGRTEHASVAAFARLTLELMALGAPPQLLAEANHDALDEIRHAQMCFGLARALDGRAESPGAFPAAAHARTLSSMRMLALGQLAVDSLIDGALHEGLSARIIAKLARRCDVPAIQVMLKEIAADEGRHARHGWDVALWCLAEGGEPVARALEGALRALPRVMASPMAEDARDGRWERFGIMGEALEAEEHAVTLAYVERRTAQAIAEGRASRHPALGYGNSSLD